MNWIGCSLKFNIRSFSGHLPKSSEKALKFTFEDPNRCQLSNHQWAPYPSDSTQFIFFCPKDSKSAPAPFPAQWEDPPQNLTPPCELVLMIKTTKKVTSNRKCWSNTLAGWAEGNYKWAASYERASTRGGRKMWRKVLKRNKRLLSQWLHVVEVDNNRRKHCKRWWLQPRHLESFFSFLLAIKGFGKIVNA